MFECADSNEGVANNSIKVLFNVQHSVKVTLNVSDEVSHLQWLHSLSYERWIWRPCGEPVDTIERKDLDFEVAIRRAVCFNSSGGVEHVLEDSVFYECNSPYKRSTSCWKMQQQNIRSEERSTAQAAYDKARKFMIILFHRQQTRKWKL